MPPVPIVPAVCRLYRRFFMRGQPIEGGRLARSDVHRYRRPGTDRARMIAIIRALLVIAGAAALPVALGFHELDQPQDFLDQLIVRLEDLDGLRD